MAEEVSRIGKKETKVINYKSCFDVIGPIMIGPSSSHTAGAIMIGRVANLLFQGKPKRAIVKYYESFAQTHKGHGTDYAIASGILGFSAADERVPHALKIAKEEGIAIEFIEIPGDSPVYHANTACITLQDDEHEVHITGISIGGGTIEIKYIEIEGFAIEPQGQLPMLLVLTGNSHVKSYMEDFLIGHHIKITTITRYQNEENRYLFVYDLDSPLSDELRAEIVAMGDPSRLIVL
ncbi:L-serine ammonia-lyase, iron-sulfur-dependent subunit beta [Vagococcus zengguangii]|uniref:L-serine deaminase n=1 Tax=Vagococcus zengguangii TaxID=2571750 RepID=A0A4D7CZS4_9ENTE|nr:L-serine ammonia-lyase, iron-sulfur-dependent subunit beta [Vagococcus zengguangii]QCI87230.1 L-serine ammonia-lyase, iron-sulfur-dependent, subunit beta [Vagococcus zengguangii]TLG80734.1 L-serine ammonia-lyase, iron-sulfur-dependent, subunit beta [Vagococcus zengguangii]